MQVPEFLLGCWGMIACKGDGLRVLVSAGGIAIMAWYGRVFSVSQWPVWVSARVVVF